MSSAALLELLSAPVRYPTRVHASEGLPGARVLFVHVLRNPAPRSRVSPSLVALVGRYPRRMANQLTRSRGPVARFVMRVLNIDDAPTTFDAGSDYHSDRAEMPSFDPLHAMSAASAFPVVYAGVDTIANDLAGLPLVCTRGRGKDAVRLEEHPALELFRQPSTWLGGVLFRRQLVVDLVLTGNAYYLELGAPLPAVLERLHPARTSIVPKPSGAPEAYQYDTLGGRRLYGPNTVRHIRGVSWQDDPTGMFGTGVIEPLANELAAEWAAQKSAAVASAKGRPDFIVSPRGDTEKWAPKMVTAIKDRLAKALNAADGGFFVNGGGLEIEQLSWSPRDMEYVGQREFNRDALLMSLGLPPAVMGIPSANYATARQQEVNYWQRLKARAVLLDEAFTRTAQRLGSPLDRISHDFSAVPALQYDRGERLNRAQVWTGLGIPPRAAARYEGFEDAPFPEEVADAAQTLLNGAQVQQAVGIVLQVAYGQLPRESAVAMLVGFFGLTKEQAEKLLGPVGDTFFVTPAAPGSAPAPGDDGSPSSTPSSSEDPESGAGIDRAGAGPLVVCRGNLTTEARAIVWRRIDSDVGKAQRGRFRVVMGSHLEKQARRYARRARRAIADATPLKAVGDNGVVNRVVISETLLGAIFDSAVELAEFREALRPEYDAAVRRAFRRMARDVGRGQLNYSAETAGTGELLGDAVAGMQHTTESQIRRIVEQGLERGDTADEIAGTIRRSTVFGPGRSAAAAQTESTRAINRGHLAAMQDAKNAGADIRGKVWLSARDPAVRDAHEPDGGLDGVTADVDGYFVVPAGNGLLSGRKAKHPGGFGVAALDINCRCLVIAQIGDQT